jgi:hypothetical protein
MGELVPLCEDLVQQCIDDRTVDFTLSLMDFVKWHNTLEPDHALSPHTTGPESIGEGGGDDEGTDKDGLNTHTAPHTAANTAPNTAPHTAPQRSSGSSHYKWPEFILGMLKKPVEWASWRKRVERAVLSNRDIGMFYYFLQIIEEAILDCKIFPFCVLLSFHLSSAFISGHKSSMKKEIVDPVDDKKSGIERSSSDEKEGTRSAGDVERALVELGVRTADNPASDRAPGPVKRRTAYFQALCDDLKNSLMEKASTT